LDRRQISSFDGILEDGNGDLTGGISENFMRAITHWYKLRRGSGMAELIKLFGVTQCREDFQAVRDFHAGGRSIRDSGNLPVWRVNRARESMSSRAGARRASVGIPLGKSWEREANGVGSRSMATRRTG
jgi:hypothetical protein